MNLSEGWNTILEAFKGKPFYSSDEAQSERFKDSTQISKEVDLETPYITYNPFSSYVSSSVDNGISAKMHYSDMVRKWREIAQLPEVDTAISEITGEAIVFDEKEDVISLNLDDIEVSEAIKTKMKDSFSKILYLLDFNEFGEDLFRNWYVDATLSLEVVYNNRKPKEGIQKLVLLPPYNVFKFKNEQTSEIRWFINNQPTYNILQDLENAEKTYFDEQITQINSGVYSSDRRNYISRLQKAIKAINQLYLLEDSLVIMRITRSPEKRAFYIDTGNLPKSKAEEYVRNLITKYRQKKIYNTETGTIENSAKSISVLEDFWFPVSSAGRGTKVEQLPGAQNNFTSFEDIDYFINKVYTSLEVPSNRRMKEARITMNNTVDVEKDEMKFFKFIQKLRRRFNNLFVDLLKKDLIAQQVMSFEDWKKIQEKIKFIYANSNEISLIKKTQILQMKMDAANSALSLLDSKAISVPWLQKTILEFTDEEIAEIANQNMGTENGGDGVDALGNMSGGGSGGGKGGDVPGYEEVGNGVNPPSENDTDDSSEEPEKEPEAKSTGSRFKQRDF